MEQSRNILNRKQCALSEIFPTCGFVLFLSFQIVCSVAVFASYSVYCEARAMLPPKRRWVLAHTELDCAGLHRLSAETSFLWERDKGNRILLDIVWAL